MKGKQKLWILFGVLAVLILANWLLGSWNRKQEELEAEESEADKVYLTEEADIVSFSYSDGENEMAFCMVDDQWCYEKDTEIPMNQDSVQAIADNITGMSAERILEDPDDLADYGLDVPQYTINYVDQDGQTLTIYIGNAVGDNYYATVGDTGEVYTVSGDFQNWLVFDLTELEQNTTETEE